MTPRARRALILVLVLLALAALLSLLARCSSRSSAKTTPPAKAAERSQSESRPGASVSNPAPAEFTEKTGPATVEGPARVDAGASFRVRWTGPGNRDDYLTIVAVGAPEESYGSYALTRTGAELELTAPVTPGACELRYVTGRSKTVLGRAKIEVAPVGATLKSAEQAVAGVLLGIEWSGPNNAGDYVTIVPKDFPDGRYANHTPTQRGSPLEVRVPMEPGETEIRYMTGQGNKVLGRRGLLVVPANVSLAADPEVVAGADLSVTYTGPNNTGDYITIVPKDLPDGQYGNYSNTSIGSPLKVQAPIAPGATEIRYMSGQGAHVLARRPLTVVAAKVTLDAPERAVPGAEVSVVWAGPDHGGDYLTIVPVAAKDETYLAYSNASSGSPARIKTPAEAGPCEIRYVSGQGKKVLARRRIEIAGP